MLHQQDGPPSGENGPTAMCLAGRRDTSEDTGKSGGVQLTRRLLIEAASLTGASAWAAQSLAFHIGPQPADREGSVMSGHPSTPGSKRRHSVASELGG